MKGTVGIKSAVAKLKEVFYGTSKGYTIDFRYAYADLVNWNFRRAFCLIQLGLSPLGVVCSRMGAEPTSLPQNHKTNFKFGFFCSFIAYSYLGKQNL